MQKEGVAQVCTAWSQKPSQMSRVRWRLELHCAAMGSSKVQAALVGTYPPPALDTGKAHSTLIKDCVFSWCKRDKLPTRSWPQAREDT